MRVKTINNKLPIKIEIFKAEHLRHLVSNKHTKVKRSGFSSLNTEKHRIRNEPVLIILLILRRLRNVENFELITRLFSNIRVDCSNGHQTIFTDSCLTIYLCSYCALVLLFSILNTWSILLWNVPYHLTMEISRMSSQDLKLKRILTYSRRSIGN